MAIKTKEKEEVRDTDNISSASARYTGSEVGNKVTGNIDWSDMSLPLSEFKKSLKPEGKDLFHHFDRVFKSMMKENQGSPYTGDIARAGIDLIPGLDPLTKEALKRGDTTLLKETYGIPAFHGLNQALFNAPRSIMNKLGVEEPKSVTAGGAALARIAGVAGALLPFGIGEQAIARGIPALAGKGFLKTTARGGIAGGAQGALLFPEDPLDFKTRGIQAVAGILLGGALGSITNRVTAVKKFFNVLKRRKGSTLKQRVKTKRLNVDISRGQDEINAQKAYNEATGILKDNADELQKNVARQQIRGKVPRTEEAFAAFRKNLNDIYDSAIDDISDEIGTVRKRDAHAFFMDLVDDLKADPELNNTAAASKIRRFTSALKKGKKTSTTDFSELNVARKKLLDRKFKGDVDDIVYGKFRKKFADYADELDPRGSFSALNKKMAPQLDFKHKFIRKLKAYDQYETGGIEGLFEKYTNPNAKLTVGEERLMNDALSYLGQFGLDIDDLQRSSKAITKVKGTLSRIEGKKKLADVVTAEKRLATTKRRGLQDIKIDQVTNNALKRGGMRILDMAVRITVARYIFKTIDSIRSKERTDEVSVDRL